MKIAKMMSDNDLVLEEYKSLRNEINTLAHETRLLVRLSIVGAAAIYAWLAVNADSDISVLGWYIPILIPIFGALLSYAHVSRISLIANYIKDNIEARTNSLNWETHISRMRSNQPLRSKSIWNAYRVFWILFLILTLLMPQFAA